MPFNLLLLPLLGGFIFARQWKRSRYHVLRSDGHVLLFYSASFGAGLLILATFISYFLSPHFSSIDFEWHTVVPFEHSGKASLAFLLGVLIWWPLNLFLDDQKEMDRVIERKEDALELLLRNAMGQNKLVLITVKNGKVYVGYVLSNLNPAFAMESIGIAPMLSGYREDPTKTACFTTRYIDAYDKIETEVKARVEADPKNANASAEDLADLISDEIDTLVEDFEIVIPVSEIQSATIFNMEIYNKHFRPTEGQIIKPS